MIGIFERFKDIITNNYVFTVLCCFLTFLLSLLAGFINNRKQEKRDSFINFYNAFEVLWDEIHQGRAYNYTDLSLKNQERIIYFFIENKGYATSKMNDYIYVLKTSRLDNFNNQDDENLKASDDAYNKLVEMMVGEFERLRKKYK